jgi:hypothetical protein
MKCISIKQPWAGLYLSPDPLKDCENRGWSDSYARMQGVFTYRGPLLIHSGKSPDRENAYYASDMCSALGVDDETYLNVRNCTGYHFGLLGVILGVVEFLGAKRYEPTAVLNKSLSYWHEPHCLGLYRANPRFFAEPIPYRGQLGLFDVPEDVVAEQLRKVGL